MNFEPGDVIAGRFEVTELLGKGGLGIVYLVQDRERNARVALKILRPEFATNTVAMERFKREVKAMRQIEQGGTVEVYDTGQIGESLFYTREYVEGENIAQLIKRDGAMDLTRALALMIDICTTIEQIHKVAIHRDIASDNVMIQPDGRVRVLDFGTARLVDEDSVLTREQMHVGKLVYSSPEQRRSSRDVDRRADIYSLGVLFYEMLTTQLVPEYVPVRGHRPELPEEVDAILAKAMADQPEDRYMSVREFRMALTELAEAVP